MDGADRRLKVDGWCTVLYPLRRASSPSIQGMGTRIEIIQKLETVDVPHEFYDQLLGIGAMPLDQRVQFDIFFTDIEPEISAVCRLRNRRSLSSVSNFSIWCRI
jgi:hypothetical protein